MSRVIDVITYNGEKDLFDIRYNILKDCVDEFIVVELDKTFTGKDKPWYFSDIILNYSNVKYFPKLESEYSKYKELAESSPNTKGAGHWKREFMQKESIKDCLTHLNDDDIVFIGDCDEIWRPSAIYRNFVKPTKFQLRVYPYYLNNESSEVFYGTLWARYGNIKNECLNHMRSTYNIKYGSNWYGWHFTSQGGEEEVRRKLNDSYTPESYNTQWVQDNLKINIEQRKDYMGRNFEMKIDESNWPQYLKENKHKYKHLLYENRTS